ncbi:MAG: BNR domain-containing protein [Gammaproteobacteria bacterium]|nr:BNR domain-containing protein [Gammaproteobacteria bacterium]
MGVFSPPLAALAGRLLVLAVTLVSVHAVADVRYAPVVPRARQSLLIDIAAAGRRLVAVGERGHVLYSDDNGLGWVQARVPATSMLTAVFFIDERRGWAVGHDGMILATTDRGETWALQRDGLAAQAALNRSDIELARQRLAALGPEAGEEEREAAQFDLEDVTERAEEPLFAPPLMDVWFGDAEHGIAVGAFGAWLDTFDGGRSWQDGRSRIDNPDENHFYAIAAADDRRLLVVGEAGIVLRSQDAGASWQALDSAHKGTLFGALALPGTATVYAYGLQGGVLLSRDFGEHWSALRSRTEVVLAGAALDEAGELLLVGSVGTILKAHGNQLGMPFSAPRRANLSAVIEAPDGTFVAVGQGGAQRLEQALGDE